MTLIGLWNNPPIVKENSIGFLYFQIILPSIIAIIVITIAYQYTKIKDFELALIDLFIEIKQNVDRVEYFEFASEIEKLENKAISKNNGKIMWVGLGKTPSFSNWSQPEKGNFYLKYLSHTNFFYFINQGFIKDKWLEKGLTREFAQFYDCCQKFSFNIQLLENNMQNNNDFLENKEYFICIYWALWESCLLRNGFFTHYNNIISNLKMNFRHYAIVYPDKSQLQGYVSISL